MLVCILSWLIIFLYSYLYGYTGIILFSEKEEEWHTVDIKVVTGIVIINVYVQIFSIFYKIGIIAFTLLGVGAVICFFYLWYRKKLSIGKIYLSKTKKVLLAMAIFSVLLWTCLSPQHYDTYLYHAQAIHWIEEYKAIPGLGNLHFRYAYNSAYLTLQAIFGFSWLLGKSLHTLNGFFAVFLLCYTIITGREQKKIILSDWLRLGMMAYLLTVCFNISSPSTDIWVILLTFYICIKWSVYIEKNITSILPYAFLCVLVVYAITLKLSVVPFLLLTIYPAIILVKDKKIKEICKHILAGISIMIPFLIRNIIISGYLVYPYPEIDLFHVDWKMPNSILMTDRQYIVVFGRQHMDITRYDEDLLQWLPEWFLSINIVWKIAIIITILSVVILAIYALKYRKREKNYRLITLAITCIAGLLFWLLSAPLPRYGEEYMLLIPCIVMGVVINDKYLIYKVMRDVYRLVAFFMIIVSIVTFPIYNQMISKEKISLWNQNDYKEWEVQETSIDGYKFYVPIEGNDQTGYEPFPVGGVQANELRGKTIEEGFRHKTYIE